MEVKNEVVEAKDEVAEVKNEVVKDKDEVVEEEVKDEIIDTIVEEKQPQEEDTKIGEDGVTYIYKSGKWVKMEVTKEPSTDLDIE